MELALMIEGQEGVTWDDWLRLARACEAAGILGELEQAAERFHELAQAGVDRVMCQHMDHRDTDFVSLLGERLAPQLSQHAL